MPWGAAGASAGSAMSVDFRLLGDLEVQIEDHLVEVGHARQRCVLVILLLDANQMVPADQLLERVWGQRPPHRARNVLSGYLSRLRQVLAHADDVSITRRPGGYVLSTEPTTVDVSRFHELIAKGRATDDVDRAAGLLTDALHCWRGEAFATLDTPWLNDVRDALEAERFAVELDRNDLALQAGRHGELLTEIAAQAVMHQLDERLVGQLILALYRCGRQGDALAAFQDMRRRLVEELGADPSPPLRHLHQQILSGDGALSVPAAGRSSHGSSRATVPRRLPAQPRSSFVGRETDVDGVLQRLTACRLVTICGTGGVGKTRLAFEVATRATGRYPDPVCLVELATLAPGGCVAAVVASALRVAERAGTSLVDRVVEAIVDRRMLLVLDNCEHVLDTAVDLVDALLLRTSGVDVLATSRTALAIDGEQVWPLAPLAVDEDEAPAVRLFGDRAVAARPGFVLDGENRPAVQRLCRRLDGLPLALELAAARLRVATLNEVGAAVHDHTELLAGARRTGQPRHRSLEGLVAWSYRLLAPAEQLLFARLSVYRGPFSVADAVAVASGEGVAPEEVPALLWSLVDQSLVVAPALGSDARYVLLETLRHYAGQRLDADGVLPRYRQRHAHQVLATASKAAAALHGPGVPAALTVLDRLLPELRAAREHLEATGDDEGLLQLTSTLFWYGFSQIHSEVLGWTRDAAGRAVDPDVPLVPAILGAAAIANWQRGDIAEARRLAQQGIDAAARLGDPPGASLPYSALADVLLSTGDPHASLWWAIQARRRAEHDGHPIELVYAWMGEALAAAHGEDSAAAVSAAGEAIHVAEASGSPIAIAWAYCVAGEVRLESAPDEALSFLERAVASAASVGERMVFGAAQLSALSLRSRQQVDHRDVVAYRELIQHWRRLGAWTPLWTTIRNLVELLIRRGDDRPAARLLGAANASPTASPAYGAEARRLDVATTEAHSRLGHEFDTEVAIGRSLGDAAAVALALQATDPAAHR